MEIVLIASVVWEVASHEIEAQSKLAFTKLAVPVYVSTRISSRVVSEISRGLKAIARELNVPVLALSQLSRQVEQRPRSIPKLADLRESGSIEQDADVVMFIYREELYKKDTNRPHIADVIIAKHRNGQTGLVSLFFDETTVSFKNLEQQVEDLEF